MNVFIDTTIINNVLNLDDHRTTRHGRKIWLIQIVISLEKRTLCPIMMNQWYETHLTIDNIHGTFR